MHLPLAGIELIAVLMLVKERIGRGGRREGVHVMCAAEEAGDAEYVDKVSRLVYWVNCKSRIRYLVMK